MKQSDDVFLFTLVDLFLQILFFGFLLVAIWYVTNKDMFKSVPDHQKIVSILKEYGVNNVKELEDFIQRLKGAGFSNYKELLDNLSDMEKAKAAGLTRGDLKSYIDNSELIKSKGGLSNVLKTVKGIESVTQRMCSPSGKFNDINGTAIPNVLARAVITKASISIIPIGESSQGDILFTKMLANHKLKYSDLQNMSHDNFKRMFGFVSKDFPGCFHYLSCNDISNLTRIDTRAFETAFRCY